MSSLGSTPITASAHPAHHRVDRPVPLPMSTASAGRPPAYEQSALARSAGGVGRTSSYSDANPLKRSAFGVRSAIAPTCGTSSRRTRRSDRRSGSCRQGLLEELAGGVVGEDLAVG